MTDSLPIPAPHREGLVDVVVQVASPVHHIGESGTTPPAVGGAVYGPTLFSSPQEQTRPFLAQGSLHSHCFQNKTAKEMSSFIVCHASSLIIGPGCT